MLGRQLAIGDAGLRRSTLFLHRCHLCIVVETAQDDEAVGLEKHVEVARRVCAIDAEVWINADHASHICWAACLQRAGKMRRGGIEA